MNREEFAALLKADVNMAREVVAKRLLIEPLERLVPRLMTRWDLGEVRYGPLILDDGRDFIVESFEESDDAVIYELFELALQRGMK
jgi:hypothetical protein